MARTLKIARKSVKRRAMKARRSYGRGRRMNNGNDKENQKNAAISRLEKLFGYKDIKEAD